MTLGLLSGLSTCLAFFDFGCCASSARILFLRECRFRGKRSANMYAKCCSSLQAYKDHLMLVSDLDQTMVDHKDSSHAALLNFNLLWAAEYANKSHLVYSTGRSMHRFMELQKDAPVLTPDILILSVGTEIRLGSSLEVDKVWAQELDDGWDRDIIVQEALKMPDLRFQEEPDQGSHKVSFKVDRSKGEEMQNILSTRLLNRGLKVRVVYSSGVDLDVLPYKAGKGQALSYLVAKLNENGMIHKNVLVCGDSGNDIDLFTVKGVHGVIVSNAQEELVKWHRLNNSNGNILRASQRCAAAIVEALHHFNFGPHVHQTEKICEKPLHNSDYSSHLGAVHREVVGLNMFMVKWLLGEVPNSESSFSRLSCVLNDNMKVILPEGIELTAEEFISKIRREYGSLQESGLYIWVDKVTAKQLAEGLYLVTWQPWERLSGMPKKGYYASAILKSKVEAPNGMEWLHYHKTFRELMDIQSLQ